METENTNLVFLQKILKKIAKSVTGVLEERLPNIEFMVKFCISDWALDFAEGTSGDWENYRIQMRDAAKNIIICNLIL